MRKVEGEWRPLGTWRLLLLRVNAEEFDKIYRSKRKLSILPLFNVY